MVSYYRERGAVYVWRWQVHNEATSHLAISLNVFHTFILGRKKLWWISQVERLTTFLVPSKSPMAPFE